MQNGKGEEVIRIRVLPEEAAEVAEWAGLMLSELVGDEVPGNGEPVRPRDPERAAELLELLVLCAEEGADAASALEPAMKLQKAAGNGGQASADGPARQGRPLGDPSGARSEETAGSRRPALSVSAGVDAGGDGCAADRHPYDGIGTADHAASWQVPAYRSGDEREEVLMAVRFGASALIELARSHGVQMPEPKLRRSNSR